MDIRKLLYEHVGVSEIEMFIVLERLKTMKLNNIVLNEKSQYSICRVLDGQCSQLAV